MARNFTASSARQRVNSVPNSSTSEDRGDSTRSVHGWERANTGQRGADRARARPDDSKTIAIYALECPILRAVFYIGRTNNPQHRLEQHLYNATKNRAINQWVAELRALGRKPELFILARVEPDTAPEVEAKWIEHYSRVSPFLLNRRLTPQNQDRNVTRRNKWKAAFKAAYLE